MTRILLLSEIYPPASGGSGRWFSEVYPRLKNLPCLAVVHEHDGWENHDLKTSSLKLSRQDIAMSDRAPGSIRSLLRYWSLIRMVTKAAKQHNATQIHAARPLHEGLVARFVARRLRIPFICYVHGEDLSVALTSRQLRFATSLLLSDASMIICNSNFTRTLMLENWDICEDQVEIINPGVDTNFFTPAPKCEATRKRLGWDKRKVVLTVGRLQRRKGQDNFIKAIPAIRKRFPDLLYAVVGEGNYGETLRDLVSSNGVEQNVMFHGEISDTDMLACYQQCDLFSLPNRTDGSDVEGFGMVSLEAQACAKPALVGDSGGTPETIAEGRTGYAIDCTQPDLIAQKTMALLTEPKLLKKFGQEARKRTVQQFDWSAIVHQSEELFQQFGRIS